VNTIIELHDSTFAEITKANGDIIAYFAPAYLHKSKGRPGFDPGSGWVQDARLIFSEASTSGDFPELPCDVMEGELIVGGERHDNHIPVPLASRASAELRLVFDSMHTVMITGQSVRLELSGEPRYVEEFKP